MSSAPALYKCNTNTCGWYTCEALQFPTGQSRSQQGRLKLPTWEFGTGAKKKDFYIAGVIIQKLEGLGNQKYSHFWRTQESRQQRVKNVAQRLWGSF